MSDQLIFFRLRAYWSIIYFKSRIALEKSIVNKDDIKKILSYLNEIKEDTQKTLKSFFMDEKNHIKIDSDWLVIWLICNVLFSKKISFYYDLEGSNNDQTNGLNKLRFLKCLSLNVLYGIYCVSQYFDKISFEDKEKGKNYSRQPFSDVPFDREMDLTSAQLYLLGEYAYVEIGLCRELNIFERLQDQLTNELQMYSTISFYRDHLYHVMDACLLGEFILRAVFKKKGLFTDRKPLAKYFKLKHESDVFKNWYLAALCHDLGYMVEMAGKIVNPISKIKGDGLDEFLKKLTDGISEGKKEIQKAIDRWKNKIPVELQNHQSLQDKPDDHGIVAWLHIVSWINSIECAVESYLPGLDAILRHNLNNQNIDVKQEPLSMMLILCDRLQEWGRPQVSPRLLSAGVMESFRFNNAAEIEKRVRLSYIIFKETRFLDGNGFECDECNTSHRHSKCERLRLESDGKGLTIILPHAEAMKADFQPCLSWLFFTRDFQCLNVEKGKWLLPIRIEMHHEPSAFQEQMNLGLWEMDVIEEYARDSQNREAAYLLEWIETAKKGQKGVKYWREKEKEKEKEIFALELDKLDLPLPRGLKEKVWRPFAEWKRNWLRKTYFRRVFGELIREES